MNFLFFWGSNHPFSNWYAIHGDRGCTSEHYYMAKKAEFFGDLAALADIEDSDNPRLAKIIGRRIKGFDQSRWDTVKFNVMLKALGWKYEICEQFRDALAASKEQIIVEASPYDRIWGIGFDEEDALENRNNWGENLLGKALMELRSAI